MPSLSLARPRSISALTLYTALPLVPVSIKLTFSECMVSSECQMMFMILANLSIKLIKFPNLLGLWALSSLFLVPKCQPILGMFCHQHVRRLLSYLMTVLRLVGPISIFALTL